MEASTRSFYISVLKKRLSPHRFEHSLNVSDEAVRLAEKYGADPEKAEIAGLLHDVMKDTPYPEQEAYLLKCGISLSEIEEHSPKLWHAISGSEFIRREFLVDDEEIISAVRYHTTAKAGMSLLEKVIYLADFTSRERNYNGVDDMRRAVDVNMFFAMREALRFSIVDLINSGKTVHPDTVFAYNDLILKGEKLWNSQG